MTTFLDFGSVVFACDGPRCIARLPTYRPNVYSSDFQAVENMRRRLGWTASLTGGAWRHHCPAHNRSR